MERYAIDLFDGHCDAVFLRYLSGGGDVYKRQFILRELLLQRLVKGLVLRVGQDGLNAVPAHFCSLVDILEQFRFCQHGNHLSFSMP